MKKLLALALAALLALSLSVALAEEIDVDGLWYIKTTGESMELLDGMALLYDEEDNIVAEGTYTADGANVTITAGDQVHTGVVNNDMMLLDGAKVYERDGAEFGYWNNDEKGSALELYDGDVWSYDVDGELTGEGTYTVDGANLTIDLAGRIMQGTVDGTTMTLDGETYTMLE